MKIFYHNRKQFTFRTLRHFSILFVLFPALIHAQHCPPNIDFEQGSFNGWTCYTGSVAAVNGNNEISLSASGPQNDRHTLYQANTGAGVDPYGGFPILCPNGSGYSIRLGNDQGGGQAEGISYEFVIPPNENTYSLIYNYAVVFQDPNHQIYQQPRMEIEIMNLSDNVLIDCSSFTFIPFGTVLPGFFESANPGSPTPVWCKDWTPVSINLNNLAGKRIRLFFKTADCTFTRHFGYAYIDVNSECSGTFVGATYCPDDTAINVVAPYGYQAYTWYDSAKVNVLGNQQVLTFRPPPPAGTVVAVELQPFPGFGCVTTMYAQLIDTLTVTANAGPDKISCNSDPVQIGSPPKPGLIYSWSPATGLSNPSSANPFATPEFTTNYVLTTSHDGGGCVDKDTVVIKAAGLKNSVRLLGKATFCEDHGDSVVLIVPPADKIQWYHNNDPIQGATDTIYRPTRSGIYHAELYSNIGCSLPSEFITVFIDKARPGIRYPVEYAVINMPATLQARDFGQTVLWRPPTNLDNPNTARPVFKGTAGQEYTVEIQTTSGCITVDTMLVKTVKNVEVYVPTAFTPNNDGLNELLRPTLMGIKELRYFRIYNRWGEMLFETKNIRDGWNGKHKGLPQGSGVIVWIMQGVGVDGLIHTRKGTTVLVR